MKAQQAVRQQWRVKLHGRKMKYGRLRLDKTVGWATDDWRIKETSGWPMGMFIPLSTYIVNAVNKVSKSVKSFDTLQEPIRNSLLQVAAMFGCEAKRKSDVTIRFLLDGKRFADFLILDFHNHDKTEFLQEPDRNGKQHRDIRKLTAKLRSRRPAFNSMERKSPAMLRFAVVVLANGLTWLIPGHARED